MPRQAAGGYRREAVTASVGIMVHQGKKLIKTNWRGGNPRHAEINDVCSLLKGSSLVPCKGPDSFESWCCHLLSNSGHVFVNPFEPVSSLSPIRSRNFVKMPAAGGNSGLCFMTFSPLLQKRVKTERGRLLPQNSEDPLKLAA